VLADERARKRGPMSNGFSRDFRRRFCTTVLAGAFTVPSYRFLSNRGDTLNLMFELASLPPTAARDSIEHDTNIKEFACLFLVISKPGRDL
jgi:hypothetical protein